MRQIRPRTGYPTHTLSPVPAGITVHLRVPARPPPMTDDQLREEICQVRESISSVVDELSALVEKRENLKAQLNPRFKPDDPSVVAWGFCEDDDL